MASEKSFTVPKEKIPRHVAVIMDGNGRWATARGLPRKAGHKKGSEAFRKIAKHAETRGVQYLTAFAFSTENWKRPADEVAAIMDLLRDFLNQYTGNEQKYKRENLRMQILGELAPFDDDLREKIARIHAMSQKNTGMNVNIALNYGGRDEILVAAKALLRRCSRGEIKNIDDVTRADFEAGLYTAGQPDVDLLIRTGGELRGSNFLLWQSWYAEYCFSKVMWPDFTPARFDEALTDYASRDRRRGGIGG